ncbi:hypothetical protein [Paucimonas lemoignei]|uniref:hypothetical protein n=1 Tax=Paucimonas lemoignei TaxID=29443 RepID=UPI0014045CCB|nr:hypothetical protein [Paucimonas lemoignei]
MPESIPGIVSPAGPIDYAPAGARQSRGEWKYSLGGLVVLAIAMMLLVLLADEAMEGGVVAGLLSALGLA